MSELEGQSAHEPASGTPALEYRSGIEDRAQIKREQVVGGALIGAAAVFGSVFAGIMAAVNSSRHGSAWFCAIVGPVLLSVAVIGHWCRRSVQRRGFGAGLWIGLGIGALIEGACFAFRCYIIALPWRGPPVSCLISPVETLVILWGK